MEPKTKRALWFVAALVIVALILKYFTDHKSVPVQVGETEAAPDSSQFYAPYYYPSAGIFPDSIPFESTVSVYVENPALGLLSNQYIPIFGLVGMTAVGLQ